jgi:hypothetical protein
MCDPYAKRTMRNLALTYERLAKHAACAKQVKRSSTFRRKEIGTERLR